MHVTGIAPQRWLAARAGTALLTLVAGGAARAGQLSFLSAEVQGVGGVNGLDVAVSVAVSPDGRHVYAAAYGDDAVSVFARNPSTGVLSYVEVQKDGVAGVDGLAGAYSVALSPDGKHVYVAGNSEAAIAVFSRDSTSGHLTFVEVQKNGVNGVAGLAFINSVTVSPDGKHVYAAVELSQFLQVQQSPNLVPEPTGLRSHSAHSARWP